MSVKVSYISGNSTNSTILWAHDPHSHTLDISYENVPSEREFYDLSQDFNKLKKNNNVHEKKLEKTNEDLLKIDKVLREATQNIISIVKKQGTLEKFIKENFSEGSFFFSEFSKILESHIKNVQKYVEEIKSYKNDILEIKKETLTTYEEHYSNFKHDATLQIEALNKNLNDSTQEIKRVERESSEKIIFQIEKFDDLYKHVEETILNLSGLEENLKKIQEENFSKINNFVSQSEEKLYKIIDAYERKIEQSLSIWNKLPKEIEDTVHMVEELRVKIKDEHFQISSMIELKSTIKDKIDELNIQSAEAISMRESQLKSIDEQYALTMKKYDELLIVSESFYKAKSSIFKRIKWLFLGRI